MMVVSGDGNRAAYRRAIEGDNLRNPQDSEVNIGDHEVAVDDPMTDT